MELKFWCKSGGGIVMGSNRTFMELKYMFSNTFFITVYCSNRTFMELKFLLKRVGVSFYL